MLNVGMSCNGSLILFRMIRNSCGNVEGWALTFNATGLYFFFDFRKTSNICSSSKWTVGTFGLTFCTTVEAGRQINSGSVQNLDGTVFSLQAHRYAFRIFSCEASTSRVYAVASTLCVFFSYSSTKATSSSGASSGSSRNEKLVVDQAIPDCSWL